jgi:hypothetical protein
MFIKYETPRKVARGVAAIAAVRLGAAPRPANGLARQTTAGSAPVSAPGPEATVRLSGGIGLAAGALSPGLGLLLAWRVRRTPAVKATTVTPTRSE